MDDWFVGAVVTLIMALLAVIVWAMSASFIAKECKLTGMFYVGNEVFTCEQKPTKEK